MARRVKKIANDHPAQLDSDRINAALNGLLGSGLARKFGFRPIVPSLRLHGADIEPEQCAVNQRITVFVHGLMDDERSWILGGWDQAARDLKRTPVLFRHPSGDPVPRNGERLSNLIERLVKAHPKLAEIDLVGYSQGGLTVRAAFNHATEKQLDWVHKVHNVLFVATPLLGADLERLVSYLSNILGTLPALRPWYLRPALRHAPGIGNSLLPDLIHFFAVTVPGLSTRAIRMIVEQRSRGIRDLRHGRYRWEDQGLPGAGYSLPPNVQTWAIAGLLAGEVPEHPAFWHTDGMVSLPSAWHMMDGPALIPPGHRFALTHVSHYNMMFKPEAVEIYQSLYRHGTARKKA